jgi:hypothetical protein
MNIATPIESFIPAACQKIDGISWLLFYNGGTFQEYKEMPNGLLYDGIKYAKAGWNSDTNTVHYKEAKLATPCRI